MHAYINLFLLSFFIWSSLCHSKPRYFILLDAPCLGILCTFSGLHSWLEEGPRLSESQWQCSTPPGCSSTSAYLLYTLPLEVPTANFPLFGPVWNIMLFLFFRFQSQFRSLCVVSTSVPFGTCHFQGSSPWLSLVCWWHWCVSSLLKTGNSKGERKDTCCCFLYCVCRRFSHVENIKAGQ